MKRSKTSMHMQSKYKRLKKMENSSDKIDYRNYEAIQIKDRDDKEYMKLKKLL